MSTAKHRRPKRRDTLVLRLLILVVLVLVIFEGRLIFTMITFRSSTDVTTAREDGDASSEGTITAQESSIKLPDDSDRTTLAGLSSHVTGTAVPTSSNPDTASSDPDTTSPASTVSNPSSPAIVKKAAKPVDDSWFRDAAFIGDSRMEGFRNASGITQGQFFTSVGMSLSSMTNDAVISTPEGGKITVAAALSGGIYNKIYLMLGANDLGEYDWDAFREGFVSVIHRFKELQPNADIYICSCIYVDESLVASTEYVNNQNVDKINSVMLGVCEEEGYYYLDLNEFLSDGSGSLISGASSDGVHLYGDYCKQMLEYLKNHYVATDTSSEPVQPETETTESETSEAEA